MVIYAKIITHYTYTHKQTHTHTHTQTHTHKRIHTFLIASFPASCNSFTLELMAYRSQANVSHKNYHKQYLVKNSKYLLSHLWEIVTGSQSSCTKAKEQIYQKL